jgi:acetylornithine deacetylase/succinyl-diaminopimelate desuccinylase-like protein
MDKAHTAILSHLNENLARFRRLLGEYLAIPSISTEADRRQDLAAAAEWTAAALRALGCQRAELLPTSGAPIVFAQAGPESGSGAGPRAPTVLIYGHYDVQPVDPVELWETEPFRATERGEYLHARGASDMKGQIVAALAACEASLRKADRPPSFKFLFEGEEEIGSHDLPEFIRTHADLLACDLCLNPDAGMIAAELPTITYGLRGLAYFELRLHGPEHDLHSGMYGGVVRNPAQVLSELIAGMHDGQGRVTLPGFYDPVRPLDEEERRELARLPMDESFYLRNAGVAELWGEQGYTPIERVGARPTLEVNGLKSGWTGEGSKTVLPAVAMAKLSMRLVPDQKPEEVQGQLERYLASRVPPAIRWELKQLAGGPPSISARDSPGVRALSAALEQVWGRRPVFRREGGSIPVVAFLQQYLGVQSLLTGFALPDDNAHSPNEKLHLPTWRRGMQALALFFSLLSENERP